MNIITVNMMIIIAGFIFKKVCKKYKKEWFYPKETMLIALLITGVYTLGFLFCKLTIHINKLIS